MIEFRTLKLEEIEQWFDHCMYAFNGDSYSESFRNYFKNHWFNDPWRDIESIFIAVEDGKILSTVRIFHRKMYLQGQMISMGGIGEVGTGVKSRGLGLSTKLLGLALEKMKYLEINISTLATSEDKLGYYGRLGWQTLIRDFKIAKLNVSNHHEIDIRPINFYKDIVKIKDIYEQYSGKLSGTIVRDSEYYWEAWVKNEYQKCLIAEIEGEVVAYIDSAMIDTSIRVREFGVRVGYEVLFEVMLEASITAFGLIEAQVMYSASIANITSVVKKIEAKGRMISLITPFYLGDKMIKTTEELIKSMHTGIMGKRGNCHSFWDTDGF